MSLLIYCAARGPIRLSTALDRPEPDGNAQLLNLIAWRRCSKQIWLVALSHSICGADRLNFLFFISRSSKESSWLLRCKKLSSQERCFYGFFVTLCSENLQLNACAAYVRCQVGKVDLRYRMWPSDNIAKLLADIGYCFNAIVLFEMLFMLRSLLNCFYSCDLRIVSYRQWKPPNL